MSRDEIEEAKDRAATLGPLEELMQGAQVLATAGLLSLTHEVMKVQVLAGVKRFYGHIDGVWTVEGGESRYTRECLGLVPGKGKVFDCHKQWLVQQGALTQEQADTLKGLKEHRDEVVHELPSHLMMRDRKPDPELFSRALDAFFALDRFWSQWAIDNGLVESREGQAPEVAPEDMTPDDMESGAGIAIRFALRSYNITFGREGVLADWLQTRNPESLMEMVFARRSANDVTEEHARET